MIEYLPHLWVTEYHTFEYSFITLKKINIIIHLSKNRDFLKTDIEQIRIPIDNNNSSIEEKNALIYNHLFDVTDLIHEKILQTNPVLFLCNDVHKEIFVISYYIRFARVLPREAIEYIESKNKDLTNNILDYNNCLNKFYYQIRNF